MNQQNETRRYVTYRVLAGVDLFFVDDWHEGPPMAVGSEIDLQVFVRAFAGKQGPMYRLVVAREGARADAQGEAG